MHISEAKSSLRRLHYPSNICSVRQARLSTVMTHQIFPLARDWWNRDTWPDNVRRQRRLSVWAEVITLANWGNIRRIIKTVNYFWLRKYLRIVSLDIICSEARSCPRASLSGNCSLLGTDNIPRTIQSVHISSPKVVYCLYNRVACHDSPITRERKCWMGHVRADNPSPMNQSKSLEIQ